MRLRRLSLISARQTQRVQRIRLRSRQDFRSAQAHRETTLRLLITSKVFSRKFASFSRIPDSNLKNSVTILRLARSFTQSVHRYVNFESAQIPEGVVWSPVPRRCAFQLCLCKRRQFVRQLHTASPASWRRCWWRTLWTWTRRNVRSVESFRFGIACAWTIKITSSNKARCVSLNQRKASANQIRKRHFELARQKSSGGKDRRSPD